MTNDIDISPEAVEHLCAIHDGYEQHGTVATLRALSAAMTKAQADLAKATAWAKDQHEVADRYAAALTQSRAETAAAYEVAAKAAMGHCYAIMSATDADARAALIAVSIRAIATPDQTAALDKLIAEAVADKDAEIEQLNQDLSDMRDNAESAYRRGYWAGGNGA